MPSEPKTVAVVGGGITGISAALALSAAGHHVHLFEASNELGGKIGETRLDGRIIPTGPDAFLARRPEVVKLATSLGLASELVSPAAASARIFRSGSLHTLPPNVLGVPATTDLGASGLLSAEGVARAAQDVEATDDRPDGDESVGDLVRRRLGDEVHEYLVDPLLGGINAGDSDRLSIAAGVPQLLALRAKHPSLIGAAAETLAQAPANPGPVFRSIEGGLNRLIDRAQSELERRGVQLHFGAPATVHAAPAEWLDGEWSNGNWTVSNIAVDQVVVTTPAYAAGELIAHLAPEAAAMLSSIDYSSVGLGILVLPPNTIDIDQAISGVLVPRLCGLHVTAVSFASHKWPKLAPDGAQILRVSVGRRTDERWSQLRDAEVIQVIRNDVSEIFGTIIPEGPAVLTRWLRSLPQYDVNHEHKIADIDKATTHLPGLTLTGAWRNGLGLPACVGAGNLAISTDY